MKIKYLVLLIWLPKILLTQIDGPILDITNLATKDAFNTKATNIENKITEKQQKALWPKVK